MFVWWVPFMFANESVEQRYLESNPDRVILSILYFSIKPGRRSTVRQLIGPRKLETLTVLMPKNNIAQSPLNELNVCWMGSHSSGGVHYWRRGIREPPWNQ